MTDKKYALLVGFNGLGNPPIEDAIEAVRTAVGDCASVEPYASFAMLVHFKAPLHNLDVAMEKGKELYEVVAALPVVRKRGLTDFIRVRPESSRD